VRELTTLPLIIGFICIISSPLALASEPSKLPASFRYLKAVEQFHSGQVAGAIELWETLIGQSKSSMSEAQLSAIDSWIEVARTRLDALADETPQTSLARAKGACSVAFARLRTAAQSPQTRSTLAEALFHLKRALPTRTKDPECSYLLGACLLYLDREDEALPHLKRATNEAAPWNPRPLNLLAELHRRRGNLDGQIAALERSLARAPEQPSMRKRVIAAMLSRNQGDDERRAARHLFALCGQDTKILTAQIERFSSPSVRDEISDRAAELRVEAAIEAHRIETQRRAEEVAQREQLVPQTSGAGILPKRSKGPSYTGYHQANDQTYPGPAALTDTYSGRYRVVGRDEFYLIRAPKWRKYRRLQEVRRKKGRTSRLW